MLKIDPRHPGPVTIRQATASEMSNLKGIPFSRLMDYTHAKAEGFEGVNLTDVTAFWLEDLRQWTYSLDFTFKQPIYDRSVAKKAFWNWVRFCQRELSKQAGRKVRFEVVVKYEWHAAGSVHLHALLYLDMGAGWKVKRVLQGGWKPWSEKLSANLLDTLERTRKATHYIAKDGFPPDEYSRSLQRGFDDYLSSLQKRGLVNP